MPRVPVASAHPLPSPSVLTFRPAASSERDAVAQLVAAAGLTTDGILARGTCYLVAERASWLVGAVGVEFAPDGACLLRSVTVRPATRGHGVGVRLVEEAMAEARRRACDRMYALASEGGSALARFGFRPVMLDEVAAALPGCPLVRHHLSAGWPPDAAAWRCEL